LNKVIPNDIEYLKIILGDFECIPTDIKNKTNINCNFENLYFGKFNPIIRSNFGNLLFEDNKNIELDINLKFISIDYLEKNVYYSNI
jgi:hypothetical protein